MEQITQKRQLAAIMLACRNPERDEGGFTYIVGYTAIMEAADELKELRKSKM